MTDVKLFVLKAALSVVLESVHRSSYSPEACVFAFASLETIPLSTDDLKSKVRPDLRIVAPLL